ncbi:PAS domain-containing sensor histidine kinase [Patescibacteria group bacterium]|nr:PAS domain-containing sensor histidine kinase [Patescibacteria group bacterium]
MVVNRKIKSTKHLNAFLSLQRELEKILPKIKKEKNELEQSLKKMDFFVDNLNEGVVIFNEKRKVLIVNKIAVKLYGYKSKTEFINDKITKIRSRDLETNKLIPYSKWPSARVLKGEVFNSSVIKIENKKNGKEWIESYSGKLVRNKNGEKFIIATVRDVTREILQRKKTEQALRALMEQKDEFINIASHELKTPITSIKAFTQILEKRMEMNKDQRNSYFLKRINKQIDNLSILISDLLDVSKITSGKLNFNMTRIDIDDLVTKTLIDLQYASESHELEKIGEIKEEVIADKIRIQQVLYNLITNAIKYSPNANKIIIVISSDRKHVKISVKDFGRGIPKKNHKKIFERFYRGKEKHGNISGFGMGLFISKEIIVRQHGEIWVESSNRKGSIFSFTLPVAK